MSSNPNPIFKLHANYEPAGDQVNAITQVSEWINSGVRDMTIHGVTGSGKTFTMANIIANFNRPTIIFSPNKILAYQLYEELKAFFPENDVHYYVSTFDLYRPEFVKYGEFHTKQSVSNEILEEMSLAATKALANHRRDVIVVSSLSCIFGTGSPDVFRSSMITVDLENPIPRDELTFTLEHAGYKQDPLIMRGCFYNFESVLDIHTDVKNDLLRCYRLKFDAENNLMDIQTYLRDISVKDAPIVSKREHLNEVTIFPATRFTQEIFTSSEYEIMRENMLAEAKAMRSRLNPDYYEQLVSRIEDDIATISQTGYCNGIENYAWYMNRANLYRRYDPADYDNMTPYTLLSFLPQDALFFIDESHLALGQMDGAAAADYSRKKDLISHGIRLPSCVINRPLKKQEIRDKNFQTIYVSATPRSEELGLSQDHVTKLFIRPTYLCDPDIELVYVNELEKQGIEYTQHVIKEILEAKRRGGAVLLRCPDKKVSAYYLHLLKDLRINAEYMLAETPAPERRLLVRRLQGEQVQVIDEERVRQLKASKTYDPNDPPMKILDTLDVIIGVNLIREGLDIPRVEKVLIVYADRGGFLNDTTSLIQVIGRAARNANGKVVIYLTKPDTMTPQIQKAIDDTLARRAQQLEYNRVHGKTPKTARANSIVNNFELAALEAEYQPEVDDNFDEYEEWAIEQSTIKARELTIKESTEEDLDVFLQDLGELMSFDAPPPTPTKGKRKSKKAARVSLNLDDTAFNEELAQLAREHEKYRSTETPEDNYLGLSDEDLELEELLKALEADS